MELSKQSNRLAFIQQRQQPNVSQPNAYIVEGLVTLASFSMVLHWNGSQLARDWARLRLIEFADLCGRTRPQ